MRPYNEIATYNNQRLYVKELNAKTHEQGNVGGVFLMGSARVMIETETQADYKQNAVVHFRNKEWRISSIQQTILPRFNPHRPQYKTVLELKGRE